MKKAGMIKKREMTIKCLVFFHYLYLKQPRKSITTLYLEWHKRSNKLIAAYNQHCEIIPARHTLLKYVVWIKKAVQTSNKKLADDCFTKIKGCSVGVTIWRWTEPHESNIFLRFFRWGTWELIDKCYTTYPLVWRNLHTKDTFACKLADLQQKKPKF